jgi:putative salt-induced outer membrane protein YdiY
MADNKDNLNKDTVYIDIDDEITAIIEKVRASQAKIVALVLPKRASVLQSIVNMKLLKRSAENAKKSLVLITSEAGLIPLAGTVGLYVARNLQSKPEIPAVDGIDNEPEILNEDDDVEFDPSQAATQSVGDLAVSSSVPLVGKAAANDKDAIETLELDDDAPVAAEDAAVKPAKTPKEAKPKKDKKLAVPDFDTFRKKLLLGVPILLLVIIGLFIVATALPKAEIVISTDTSSVNSNLAVTIDTSLKAAKGTSIPAQLQKVDKAGSQQVATTGKKNKGDKATGTVSMSVPCSSVTGSPIVVPAGTGVTASSLTFITQTDVSLGSSAPSFPGGVCHFNGSTNVTAQAGGAQYNIGATPFKVSSYPGVDASSGSSMSGGTDSIVQVVAQSDIDSATQKITASNSDSVKSQLEQQLKTAGQFPLDATFVAGTPNTTASSKAGDEASTVSVSQTTTYTMFGVKEDDLKKLVDNDIKDKIDPSKQSILDEGLSKAAFKVNSTSATGAQLAISTVATAGPDLNADKLKAQLAGMKAGEVKDTLTSDPGVSAVDVHLSPFWVTSVPKKAAKVTITFQKAN